MLPCCSLSFRVSRSRVLQLQAAVDSEKARLAGVRVREDSGLAAEAAAISGQAVPGAATLEELLRRPHVHFRCARPLLALKWGARFWVVS